ncbi:MAG: putative rane protein [Bacillales bacterium]|jgi:uncharacterized integral membrane protein (TIGR00698 family)|nr:putative rane protein [Bacillales bacterium]
MIYIYFPYDYTTFILKQIRNKLIEKELEDMKLSSNLFTGNENILKRITELVETLPGLIICLMIAWVSVLIGNHFPSIGSASIAIFFGMIVGNALGNKKKYHRGTKFAESNLLSYSIVLLGGTTSAHTLLKIGGAGVTFIVLQMVVTILFVIIIGKKLGFSENYRFLMASGNAVCGSSAIAATAPVIEANESEKGIAITIVNATGIVLMLLLPIIAKVVYSMETEKTSALIGGILQSLGQVVASSSLVNEDVKSLSIIFKIVRIIFLVFVVFSFGMIKKKSSQSGEKYTSKIKVPWFVIGFFATCTLFTMNVFSTETSKLFKLISNNFEIIALVGIGMRVNLNELKKQGLRITIYALGIAITQIISAVVLIMILI